MSIKTEIRLLTGALEELQASFNHLPSYETDTNDTKKIEKVLSEVAQRMQNNKPYFHPLYAGQMQKPPHAVAKLAYALSMWLNPNNHSLEGGRASTEMEKEAVAQIAQMFGWSSHLGHLSGGGTLANIEALWIASKLHPGKAIAASTNAHYNHKRICELLGCPFIPIPVDKNLRMDINALEQALQNHSIGTVVATMGTTLSGSVDPLPPILALSKKYKFRVHADAAYGGYYALAQESLGENAANSFKQLEQVDSIVIDPHKHGMLPYGCGCILFKDVSVLHFYKHDCSVAYLCSPELNLGEISLECSRPGASAVALWATQQLFPLTKDGEFASNLAKSRRAALTLWKRLSIDERFIPLLHPELDIVLWAVRSNKASLSSMLAEEVRSQAAAENLFLVISKVPSEIVVRAAHKHNMKFTADSDDVICLRSCLMKADHLDWLDNIWQILSRVTTRVLSSQDDYTLCQSKLHTNINWKNEPGLCAKETIC